MRPNSLAALNHNSCITRWVGGLDNKWIDAVGAVCARFSKGCSCRVGLPEVKHTHTHIKQHWFAHRMHKTNLICGQPSKTACFIPANFRFPVPPTELERRRDYKPTDDSTEPTHDVLGVGASRQSISVHNDATKPFETIHCGHIVWEFRAMTDGCCKKSRATDTTCPLNSPTQVTSRSGLRILRRKLAT